MDLGRIDYDVAFALQRHLVAERDAERIPDVLLLLEHPSVITLGRRGSRAHIHATQARLDELGIAVKETNRGGLVTYHGPGQVIGYPIARLRRLAGDAPAYVRGLEEMIIRSLADFGIAAHRDANNRGVFASSGKIAAIGVAVTHGVTMHGFAVNVHPNLEHFALIDPCGLETFGVTSAERAAGTFIESTHVARSLAFHFGALFGRTLMAPPRKKWEALMQGAAADESRPAQQVAQR